MTRGLLWLPLLITFIWLAWAGWNEYQKLEAYKEWAQQFERSKYDIYAVLGQNGSEITWGKPTRKGPVNLQTFSLQQVKSIEVWVGDRAIDLNAPPTSAKSVVISFQFTDQDLVQIPFTELPLAIKWGTFLQQELHRLKS